jgi:hypothetical protein
MKVYATSLWTGRDREERFSSCGYTTHTLWKNSIVPYGKIEFSTIENCDVIFLFTSYLGTNYVFDKDNAKKISDFRKPIVIFDYSEYGGHEENHLHQFNLYGHRLEHDGLLAGDYKLLNEFLLDNQILIKCYFKRELSSRIDVSTVPFKVYPLEFIGDTYVSSDEPDSPEIYYKRPCLLNFIWGYSNLSRPKLQGGIMLNIDKFNTEVAYSYRQVQERLSNPQNYSDYFFFMFPCDWYERIPTKDMMTLQKKSRMVIDLYGCGLKCFRNIESTANCLSVKQDPSKLIYTYPWIDGENCILLPTVYGSNIIDVERSVEILIKYRHQYQHLLYNMYLNSIKMNFKYSPMNYVPNHIVKNVVNSL